MKETVTYFKGCQKMIRVALLILLDIVFVNLAAFYALFVYFDFSIAEMMQSPMFDFVCSIMIFFTPITLMIFTVFRLYNSLWQFAGADELMRVILSAFTSTCLYFILFISNGISLPPSYLLLYFLFLLALVSCLRFFYRLLRIILHTRIPTRRTMIIGAGDAGYLAIKTFQDSRHSENEVICLIDDDKNKKGVYVHGAKVVGNRDTIVKNAKRYKIDEIVLAIPSASPMTRREILDICRLVPNCSLKTVPELCQLINNNIEISDIRSVDIEDLLGRDEIVISSGEITSYVSGRTVLVTGGGGSIGSELCRQIAKYSPKKLIIFDIYENNAYSIQQELRWNYPNLDLTVLIGTVRDRKRLDEVFVTYHPHIVYHAAAHKHVPLMEESPCEAVKNNVFGTYNTAMAAIEYGAEKFIQVSTDKAVNPTNIMGATKQICEMIIRSLGKDSSTEFVAVRFGNVLNSNGSVIPLFQKQIKRGGPVTVTHPDITRFFMTIPEAVSLILQAGSYAKGGEIFVLDMGGPVRINDLARNLISLSGYRPGIDIEIKYTGLRPGEKLYEEPLVDLEHMTRTANHLIYVEQQQEITTGYLNDILDKLRDICSSGNKEALRAYLHEILPTFRESGTDQTSSGSMSYRKSAVVCETSSLGSLGTASPAEKIVPVLVG